MKPVTASVGPRQANALVSKFINCLVASNGHPMVAARIAEEKAPALKVLPEILQRSAVGAQPLGSTDPFKFAEDIYVALVVDNLRNLMARFTRIPLRTKIPYENAAGGSAAWLGQGLPAAVLKSTSAVATLDVFKLQALTALSRELFRFDPDAEQTFMRILRDDVSRFLATALFDSSKSATSNNPASLTNIAGHVTSSGSSASQMISDINSMIALLGTAIVDPVFVMRPKTFARICTTLAGVGLNASRDNLFGLPVFLLSGMPQEIVIIDCASVFIGGDAAAELSVSTDASLEMSDGPSQSGISGTGANLTSFWQTGMVGVSAILTANWVSPYMLNSSPNVPSGIVYMSTTY